VAVAELGGNRLRHGAFPARRPSIAAIRFIGKIEDAIAD
jgi:hypothetical protein